MKHWTLTSRAVLPCAMLMVLANLPGCAQTGGTTYEAVAACQGLRLALADQPQQSNCGMRASVARLASGHPLYTVLETEEPQRDLRLVRVDAQLLRLELSGDAQADAARAQRGVQIVVRP